MVLVETPDRSAISPIRILPLDLPVRWKPYRSAVHIDLLYVPGCPNLDLARILVELALARTQLRATVRERAVHSLEEAERLGMRGSPTILIDGDDPFADRSHPAGMACRLYRSDGGVSGVPTLPQIVEAFSG
jgi:hypothetical protein